MLMFCVLKTILKVLNNYHALISLIALIKVRYIVDAGTLLETHNNLEHRMYKTTNKTRRPC